MALDRRVRWAIGAAVALVALLVAPCCLGGLWYGKRTFDGSRDSLDATIEEYRARGEPMTVADLAPEPDPTAVAAGDRLRAAWEMFAGSGPPIDEVWAVSGGAQADYDALDVEARSRHVATVERCAPMLAEIEAALEAPRFRFDGPIERVMDPDAPQFVRVVRGLSHCRAMLQAAETTALDRGLTNADRWRMLIAESRTATRWKGPTELAGHAYVMRTIEYTVHRLAFEIAHVPDAATVLSVTADELLSFDVRAAFLTALRHERAQMTSYQRRSVGDEPGASEIPRFNPRASRAAYIDFLVEFQEFLDDPPERWVDVARHMHGWGERGMSVAIVIQGEEHAGLARYSMAVLLEAAAAAATQQRIARVAIAAVQYRDVHDRWPDNASDLIADFPDGLPRDPFGDGALELRRDGDELVIRSVGPVDVEIWSASSRRSRQQTLDISEWRLSR